MQPGFWEQCLVDLQNNFDEQQFNTWVRPLQAITQNKTINTLEAIKLASKKRKFS